ncbi:serine hydrolase [Kitasatospora sp. NPDC057940]|uniref:serine hydrolase n=1 Tax=Kitasatospora sp. NPDC057940 TaxID=3346285 RepID=UPI0036DA31EA
MTETPGTDAPLSAAQAQVNWLVDASARAPMTDTEIHDHIAAPLLAASGGPNAFNAVLHQLGPITLRRIVESGEDHVQAAVSGRDGDYLLRVRVDPSGLVNDVSLTPDEAPLSSWTQVDDMLADLGARVSFAATRIGPDGRCELVHGVRADTQRPIGSAFKLYVLGALAQAVDEQRASWDESLAIRDDYKSLPSGRLQDCPAGTTVTMAEFADCMISLSDNTATDHLIHRLGQDAVVHQMDVFGHQQPRANIPCLTTKAFFQLKANQYPARADEYLALPEHHRSAALRELERLPLPDVRETWPQPRRIDQIEWFASPIDICNAYAALWRFDQPEIGHALALNDDGLNLAPSRFPTVWYKGGSEPGVITLNYLARTSDDRTLATSLMVSDAGTAPDKVGTALKGQAVIRGAFDLLTAEGV